MTDWSRLVMWTWVVLVVLVACFAVQPPDPPVVLWIGEG